VNRFDEQAYVFYSGHRREQHVSAVAALVAFVVWLVTIFVLLTACDPAPTGTVSRVQLLPNGTYQLQVVDGYRPGDDSDVSRVIYRLVNAGTVTGCATGERWPGCD
jgi:hypothetical protein